MLYMVYRVDREGTGSLRERYRSDHAAYLNVHADIIKVLGPTLSLDGAPTGTLAIIDCPDLESAQAWATNDPYAQAGVFETIAIKAWKVMRGQLG